MRSALPKERRCCAGLAHNQTVEPSLSGLIELGACLAGSPREETRRLAMAMLAESGGGRWRSSLNNDGSPLQVGVSLSKWGIRPAVRLIADPAAEAEDGQQRWSRAGRVLSNILGTYAPDLRRLCNSVIERILPTNAAARAALPGGAIWLAADLSGQGMALYATTKWGTGSERWMRTHRWLDEILPAPAAAHEILDRLASRTVLISAGIEGKTPGDARAKLYFRLDGTAALNDLGLALFDSAAIREFLHEVIESRRIPRAAIVGSIGFRVANGSMSDVKLDVCAHCVRRTPADWMQVIDRSIARHKLSRLPVESLALLETEELAFIGLGLDAEWMPRLNLYLKKPAYEGEDTDTTRIQVASQ